MFPIDDAYRQNLELLAQASIRAFLAARVKAINIAAKTLAIPVECIQNGFVAGTSPE